MWTVLLLMLILPGTAAGQPVQEHAGAAAAAAAGISPEPHWRPESDGQPELQWRTVRGPSDIAPPGWRRGDGGWQRIDGQPLPDPNPSKTINDLIRQQRTHETASPPMRLLATLMMRLRMLDPITLAAAEISAFSLLAYRGLCRK